MARGYDVSVQLGGTLHPRVTYAVESDPDTGLTRRIGFGVRRMRLTLYADLENRILIFTQLEGASPAGARFLDLRVGYRFSDTFLVQTGRFISAQPRSFAITLQNEIDAIERSAIAIAWASQTLGTDGRSYGIETILKYTAWEIRGTVHNGHNQDNFRPRVEDEFFITGSSSWPAVGASLIHFPSRLPGVEAGIYGGYNPSRNPNTELDGRGRRYFDYSSHFYWGALPGSQPLRFKADLIGIRFEGLESLTADLPDNKQDFLGWSVLGAWRPVMPMEAFIRTERYGNYSETGNSFREFITTGITYSLSASQERAFMNQRLTLGYTQRFGSDSEATVRHSIILQFQLVF